MPNYEIRYDFRCPPGICPAGPADLYEAALEQQSKPSKELVKSVPDDGAVLFHPLMGGLDPEIAWENLRMFESEVLPHVR